MNKKQIYHQGTRKKVVHITTVHHPYDPRIYYKQCMSLAENGYEVTLIAQDTRDKTEVNNINHIRLKTYKSRWKRMLFGVWDAYKKAKAAKGDIYVFHDPELIIAASWLKRKNNTVIYDIHEDYVTSILQKKYLSPTLRKVAARGYKLIEKFFTRNMEKSLAEKYYKDIYPNGTCILNYPLMDKKFLEYDRTAKPLSNKVLYTGNVNGDRGAFIHANIPNINQNIKVQYVGKCVKSIAHQIMDVAKENKDNIQIMGVDQFIVKEEMEKMYTKENWLAGIAVFPPTEHYMKKELTKFFEYMNVGLPIICSNFPVWKEFIEKYECGIVVDPYNEQEINEALQKLIDYPEIGYKMGKNGKKAVASELNWKAEEGKLLDWYDQLLNKEVKI